MSALKSLPRSVNLKPYRHWQDLAGHFPCARECFAAYLALEGAEVVGGEKPGNLVNLVNKARACGLNPYRLWKEHGVSLLADTDLRGIALIDRGDSMLLYLYREDLLARLLEKKGVRIILSKQGYDPFAAPRQILRQLGQRVRDHDFPHEIGIFLGYPLKDVLAFMGHIRLAFSCQGPWKIYGDPRASLELANRFRECRSRMADQLYATADPVSCLKGGKMAESQGLRETAGRC